jgi:integrase
MNNRLGAALPVAAWALPSDATTIDGQHYDPRANEWHLLSEGGRAIFTFKALDLSEELLSAFKRCSMNLIAVYKVSTAVTYQTRMLRFLRFIANERPGADEITLNDILNYQESVGEDRAGWASIAHIVIRHWGNLGLPGIAQETLQYAREANRRSSGTQSGRAVRIRCPIQGAYSELEFAGIQSALHAKFATGEISTQAYAMALLSLSIAPRPLQISLLRVKDLIVTESADGTRHYILRVPRIKQRMTTSMEVRHRPVTPAFGAVLEALAAKVRQDTLETGRDPEDAPLFPSYRADASLGNGSHGPNRASAGQITKAIIKTIERLGVQSERTGALINANATRSRRTLGTRAAAEGKGALIIAELLDHSNASSAAPYIEARPEMLERIDRALAFQLAPLAQRFAGKIVRSDEEQNLNIARHVLGVTVGGEAPKDLGGCGKHAFCAMAAPIACYTCLHFYPWEDGPHEEILAMLLKQREVLSQSVSTRIAAVNDETILAVADVVLKIQARRRIEKTE